MAIYHLNVSSIGKTTHQPGTAGAHARYIARPDAASAVEAAHMPENGNHARAWLNHEETQGRKNGRVITKVRVALPRELSHEENTAAVRDFVSQLTGENRVPWMFAIHDKEGNDRQNPHAHIIIQDKDVETGKAVCKFSASKKDREKAGLDPNPVTHARQLWEEVGNRHLEKNGHEAALDSRTLEAQNVDRKPTIHEGPRAQAVEQKGDRPESEIREIPIVYNPENLPSEYVNDNGQRRELRYDLIDQGRTRSEYNDEIRAENERRSRPEPEWDRLSDEDMDAIDGFMIDQVEPEPEETPMTDSPETARQRLEDAQKKLSRDEAERVSKAEDAARQHREIAAAKEAKDRELAERREEEGISPEFNEQTPDPLKDRQERLREQLRSERDQAERAEPLAPRFKTPAEDPRDKQQNEADKAMVEQQAMRDRQEELRQRLRKEKEREKDRGDPER